MTDHPEQPKPSLVERLTPAVESAIFPEDRDSMGEIAVRVTLRELAAYLRETPEEQGARLMFDDDEKARRATTGIPLMSWDEVGETFRRTWRQRFRSAKTFFADHLEKEAGNG